MLPTTLNTNEVKNSAGTEQEFSRLRASERELEFAVVGEAPNLRHRLKVSHQETGTGLTLRRRSLVRVDKEIAGQVDTTKAERVSVYVVADLPVGNMTAFTEATNVMANVLSFCASLGATTTILYDGTGNGAAALINGSL